MSDVSFVLPNYNGAILLPRFFPSVLECAAGAGCEVIVVDDASEDESVRWLKENAPDVRILVNERNLGFGRSANRGVEAARTEWVLLLNTDVLVPADLVERLRPHLSDDDLFAVTFRADAADGRLREGAASLTIREGQIDVVFEPDAWPPRFDDGRAPSAYAVGGHAAFHRERFLELGGFDPLYHPAYWEDTDLGYRAWRRGYFIEYVDDPRVVHHHAGVIQSMYKGKHIRTIWHRNRVLFTESSLTDATDRWRSRLAMVALLPRFMCKGSACRNGLKAALMMLKLARRRRKSLSRASARSHAEVMGIIGCRPR